LNLKENTAAIILAKLPLRAAYFDGDNCCGPVPTFFSEDTEATESWLEANVDKAHSTCQRLCSRYICVEELEAREAADYIQSPKEGQCCRPLLRNLNGGPPPSKRQRRAEDPPASDDEDESSSSSSSLGIMCLQLSLDINTN